MLGDRQNHPQPTWVQDLDARLVPWLSDHRVGGTVVLPAAAYLEMAAAAVREYVGETTIFLEDIRFHRLLLLPDEHAVRTCVRLDPSSSTFQVLSASSADPSGWELHAEGIYRRGRVHDALPVDLESTRRELDVARTADDVYRELSAMGQTYGTAFRGLESLLLQGSSRALGAVRDPITRESCQYLLFPPSLDSCFHPAVALKDEQGKPDRAVVVASLRQLKIFRPMPEKVWSHVTIVERRNGSHFGDFTIFDTTGAVVAQAQGLCVREIEPERKAASDDRTYVLGWEAADAPEAPPLNGDAAEVLILCDGEGFGERIAAHLRTRRIPVTTVCNEDARRDIGARSIQVDRREPGWAERLFETLAARGPLSSRIIDLWNWTTAEAAPAPGAHGCDVLLDLVHARLAHSAANDPARWLIVTRNAQSAAEGEPTLPVRAALWGFVRTLRTEHPAWGLALVDCADAALVEPLVRELYATDIEPEVALHREERKVRRLRRLREQVPQESQRVGRRPPAYALRIGQPGRIDALAFTGEPRRLPSAGEVEVEIAAAALNFRDVMKVLGIYP